MRSLTDRMLEESRDLLARSEHFPSVAEVERMTKVRTAGDVDLSPVLVAEGVPCRVTAGSLVEETTDGRRGVRAGGSLAGEYKLAFPAGSVDVRVGDTVKVDGLRITLDDVSAGTGPFRVRIEASGQLVKGGGA